MAALDQLPTGVPVAGAREGMPMQAGGQWIGCQRLMRFSSRRGGNTLAPADFLAPPLLRQPWADKLASSSSSSKINRKAFMKTSTIVVVLLASSLLSIQAQYQVVENGANYRVLQKPTVENGTNRVRRYTEMASGLNFQNPTTGQWTEAQEQISIQPQGGAAAVQGQHQVYFPPDIGSGVLKVVTPDGRVLQSRPLGVTYDDGKKTVFIGVLTNSAGWLTASNQVTYRDCFTGIHADLVCTYRRGGFECDLVFRSRPDDPSVYGLSDADSTVQLITEFFHTADPQQIPDASDDWFGLQDDTLNFGRMTMSQGRAFGAGSINPQPSTPNASTPVYKSWLHLGGRTFLLEQVPLLYLADDLDALPLTSRIEKPESGKLKFASNTPEFPAALPMAAETNRILIASAGLNQQPGVVLDYNVVDMDQGDYTFASGQTYYISGGVNIGGTTTFGAGTVLKFPEDGSGGLFLRGNIVCATTAYSPAVFTSVNDDSVGDPVDGSSGTPASNWASDYLSVYNGAQSGPGFEFDHCRFYYAGVAVDNNWGNSIYNDVQFVQCGYTCLVPGGDVLVENSLVSGCYWFADTSGNVVCENVTFNQCTGICDGPDEFINCIFSSVASIGFNPDPYGPPPYSYDGSNNSFDNPDQAFGGDVVTGSIVDAGNTTADQVGLYWWTTQGPIEGTSIVDLGYHTPAVDANGNPIDTTGNGPDYLLDANGDGLPDTWEMQYFGSLNGQSASTLDPLGNTLLSDYQNGVDLSAAVSFTVRLGNQNFNTTSGTGNYVVLSGVPYYEAVLVNDTNLNDAAWNNYDGNIYLNLGPTDGVYQVWFGLKGLGASAQPAWFGTDVTLNRSKPQIFITSPVTNVVATPYIQLQGFSALPLAGVTFDVSNAVAVVTNQEGFLTGHYFDTNTQEYTTDYFQCFDIPLTNGPNLITLRATDPAGNVTVSNFTVTLDYSTASNPVIKLYWPQFNTAVVGTSFTLRGWTEDASATVSAQITDANGDTNVIGGMVEREGTLWVENLPLYSGTNWLTLSVTNSAGLSSETNLVIVQSTLNLTINPLSDDSWQPAISVSGTISDPGDYTVWVNGVKAVLSGNNWTAQNVPLPGGSTPVVQARAIPNTNNGGNGTGGSNGGPVSYNDLGNPDPPSDNDTESEANPNAYVAVDSVQWTDTTDFSGMPVSDGSYEERVSTWGWNAMDGGGATVDNYTAPADYHESYTVLPDWSYSAYHYDDTDGYVEDTTSDIVWNGSGWGQENGKLHAQGANVTEDRGSKVATMLHTGGKGSAGRQNLFSLTAGATEELAVNSSQFNFFHPEGIVDGSVISNDQISIDKEALNADGIVYKVYPDGAKIDVTPKVKVPMYRFSVGATKYKSHFYVFVCQPYPGFVNPYWPIIPIGFPTWRPSVNAGHAWWGLSTEAPVDVVNQKANANASQWLNQQVGYGCTNLNWSLYHWSATGPGELPFPYGNPPTVSGSYSIGFQGPGVIDGLNYTENLHENPGTYNLGNNNCVIKTVGAGSAVGVTLPTGPNDWKPEYFGAHLPPNN
jgi:hypothetical protein